MVVVIGRGVAMPAALAALPARSRLIGQPDDHGSGSAIRGPSRPGTYFPQVAERIYA
jgi:hypothetical protein